MRLLEQFQTFHFFYDKTLRAKKAQKAYKALKITKSTKSIKTQPSKSNRVTANKRISNFFYLRCFLYIFFYFCLL